MTSVNDKQWMNFYCNGGTDNHGRMLIDILRLSDKDFEHQHDFIQWLFPLDIPSRFNASSPLLTLESVEAFLRCDEARMNLVRSYARLLRFLGLEWVNDASGSFIQGVDNFEAHAKYWLNPGNHNYLRITRVLKSLRLLQRPDLAAKLFQALENLNEEYGLVIGEAFDHWRDAMRYEFRQTI